MSSAADPGDMDRDELEEEVKALRTRLDELEAKVDRVENNTVGPTVLNHLLERLIPELEVEDYTSDPTQKLATVESFGKKLIQTVDAVEEAPENPKGDPMTDNWRSIIKHARTLQDNPNHQSQDGYVTLYAQDVADATDSSKRWARDLIEELGEGHEGAKWRPAMENPKSGSGDRKKALYVNLDVWGETA